MSKSWAEEAFPELMGWQQELIESELSKREKEIQRLKTVLEEVASYSLLMQNDNLKTKNLYVTDKNRNFRFSRT